MCTYQGVMNVGFSENFEEENLLKKPKFHFISIINLSIVRSFYINALFVQIKFKNIEILSWLLCFLQQLKVKLKVAYSKQLSMRRCFVKMVFYKFCKIDRKILATDSGCKYTKCRTPMKVFSCEFHENLWNLSPRFKTFGTIQNISNQLLSSVLEIKLSRLVKNVVNKRLWRS